MLISIVTPVYNETENVLALYKRLRKCFSKDFPGFNYEIIFIDDGSTDNTFDKVKTLRTKDKKVKVIQFSRNFGQHVAISAGLKFSRGDLTVVMDSDLQDRPEEILNLYKVLKKGNNVVYSVRKQHSVNLFKNLTSKSFWFLIKFLTGLNIPPNQSMLKIFDKKILKAVNQFEDSNPFYPAIFSLVGFKQEICAVRVDKRFKGKSKYTISKMISLAINAILGYSYKRISYIYMYLIIGLFILSFLILLGYKKFIFISQDQLLFSFLMILIFIVFISIFFVNISYYYFSKTFRNISKTPGYIINNKLL